MPEETTPLDMVWIASGIFRMGSPDTEEGRLAEDEHQFTVRITKGFWLGRYPVTQAQWQAVTGNNPSKFKGLNHPVDRISWFDARDFCEQLNQRFADHLPESYRFSLPTEAQWEYACRAGTNSSYYNGSTIEDLSRAAWFQENSNDSTHPVGQKEPNRWGLYDMLGNVWEWCMGAPSRYPSEETADWLDFDEVPLEAVSRGGGWGTPPGIPSDVLFFRCAFRNWVEADTRFESEGMRLCLRWVE